MSDTISHRTRLAATHLQRGKPAEAKLLLSQELAKDPGNVHALRVMRLALSAMGEHEQAAYYAQRLFAKLPDDSEAANLYGNSLAECGKFAEAEKVLRESIAKRPEFLLNHAALANTLLMQGRFIDVLEVAQPVLEKFPTMDPMIGVAATALLQTGRADDAALMLRDAGTRNPQDLRLLGFMCGVMNYAQAIPPSDLLAAHYAFGRMLASMMPTLAMPRTPVPEDRAVRVGFVGGDFRAHASDFFLLPLVEKLDASRVKVFIYHTSPREDASTAAYKAVPGVRFANIARLNPLQASERIRSDKLDVLIDVSGHTAGTALPTLHTRCAPVQASYLGYPCTTGVGAIDWRIVDARTDPPGFEAQSSEKLWRLEPCFMVYRPPFSYASAPETGPAPNTSAGHVTFGCFSSAQKLNEQTLRRFARVMRETPGSKLVLKAVQFKDQRVREDFARRFEVAGIAKDRVIVEPPAASARELLPSYQRIDITLDTFPYAGNTTVCESLFMGVPVVTMMGKTSASRGAVPSLAAAGLEDLITTDEDAFVDTAVRLAKDEARRVKLRRELRSTLEKSVLRDEAGMAQRFERMLRQMCSAT